MDLAGWKFPPTDPLQSRFYGETPSTVWTDGFLAVLNFDDKAFVLFTAIRAGEEDLGAGYADVSFDNHYHTLSTAYRRINRRGSHEPIVIHFILSIASYGIIGYLVASVNGGNPLFLTRVIPPGSLSTRRSCVDEQRQGPTILGGREVAQGRRFGSGKCGSPDLQVDRQQG